MSIKLAANTWCYRDIPMEEAVERIASFAVDGVELIAHAPCWHVDARFDDDQVEHVKRFVAGKGLDIAAISPATDYLQFTDEGRDAQVEHTNANVDLAVKLGTSIVRIFSGGNVPQGRTWQECVDVVIAALRECAAYAEAKGIKLAIESHGKFGTDLNAMVAIIEGVASAALGVTLDTANFYVNGVDPVEAARRLAGRIYHTHLKDAHRLPDGRMQGAALGEGDVPISAVIDELKRQNYDGFYCIEYEGREDPNIGLRKSIEYLRSII